MFFENVSRAHAEGLVTPEVVESWLEVVFGADETPEKTAKRAAVVKPDGSVVLFQVSALHRAAKEEAEDRANRAPSSPPAPEAALPPVPEELLVDVPEPVYDSPLPDLAGEIKQRLGIIAAVRKWGKPQDRIRDTRTEGIKVRCPFPSHNDENPSAWVNTDKNVWNCGKCNIGGDVIDFYAARKGRSVPGFHTDGSFHELVNEMGGELGLSVVKRGNAWELEEEGKEWPSPLPDRPEAVEEPEPRDVPAEADPSKPDDPQPEPPVSPVVPPSPEAAEPVTISEGQMLAGATMPRDEDETFDGFELDKPIPELNWRELPINPGSFLGEWMQYHEEYLPWTPPEYALFCGIQAVGLATGHSVTSFTGATLSGSLMIALIGPSGYGKSTVVSTLRKMLNRVGIVKFDKENGTGVKVIPSPGSAEALVHSIRTEVMDPVNPEQKMEVGVTAWLHEDELATIVEKSRRRGGGAMKTRIIQLYDFVKSKPEKETVIEDFSLSGGTRALHDSFFSAVFTTQTDAIRNLMDRVDLISGFLNRMIPVMGVQRERRRIADAVVPPAVPDFDLAYETLWRRCRDKVKVIPFTRDALFVVDSHPFLETAEKLATRDSLYSRVNHMTMKIAFLLAVNNNELEVGSAYVNAACEVGSSYLMACFGQLRTAVIATETDEAAERIHRFVKNFHDRHGLWPETHQWSRDRSYRDFDSTTKLRALDNMAQEGRLVRIRLQRGKAVKKVFVIPEGKWSGFVASDDKLYKYDEFYGIKEEASSDG